MYLVVHVLIIGKSVILEQFPDFCKILESVKDKLDTIKAGGSTTHSRLSEPNTVSDLYRIDYTEHPANLLSYRHLE